MSKEKKPDLDEGDLEIAVSLDSIKAITRHSIQSH